MRVFALILGIFGWLMIVAGNLFCLVKHPEWTNSQAFINLWYIWLCGSVFGISGIGILLKDKKE